jgi:hypothetical protein
MNITAEPANSMQNGTNAISALSSVTFMLSAGIGEPNPHLPFHDR